MSLVTSRELMGDLLENLLIGNLGGIMTIEHELKNVEKDLDAISERIHLTVHKTQYLRSGVIHEIVKDLKEMIAKLENLETKVSI